MDKLDGQIIKMCAHVITDPTYIVGWFVFLFFFFFFTLIHKSGHNKDPSNYITILSVPSKSLEKLINKHLLSYVKTNELIHPYQSGVREQNSCLTALTKLVDTFKKKIFYKNITINLQLYLFVDFAKAFDVIDNDLLLGKVALYGLHNDTLHLISSFRVKSRTAFV